MRLLRGAGGGERDNQAVAEPYLSLSLSLSTSLFLSACLRLELVRESAHKRQAKSIPEYPDLTSARWHWEDEDTADDNDGNT